MELKEVLEFFENKERFHELNVREKLNAIIQEDGTTISPELKAEFTAFNLVENYKNERLDWSTYFGPLSSFQDENGTIVSIPELNDITPDMISYWEERLSQTKNPILKAHYAGIVWEFKLKITKVKPHHNLSEIYVSALIEIAQKDLYKYETGAFIKLERALNLALSVNKSDLINQAKNAILSFESRHSIDEKPGLWGYAMELLVKNKKVELSDLEEQNIVTDLENKLSRLTGENPEQKIDTYSAQKAAVLLAEYYQRKEQEEEVERVLLKLGEASYKTIDEMAGMRAAAWLENLRKIYLKFKLIKEAQKVLLRIRAVGEKTSSEMKEIHYEAKVPSEAVEWVIADIMCNDLKDSLAKMADFFIPKKADAESSLDARKGSIMFFGQLNIYDKKGRTVAIVGPLDSDLEGHIIMEISERMKLSGIFLQPVMDEFINVRGLNSVDIIHYLESNPLISDSRLGILKRGLDAYFTQDYMVFIHLIVPQIEEALRNIVELAGGNVLKPAKNGGGFHLKTFDEILRDPIISEGLGEDYPNYFRILFTDPRGWNIRNSVCHGMLNANMFGRNVADRVLHALLCLGLVSMSPIE